MKYERFEGEFQNGFAKSDTLTHYGVAGMKWGVRKRYENRYGNYTRAGVKRFNKNAELYDRANQVYKRLKASNASADVVRVSKDRRNAIRKELRRNYRDIKKDAKADRGQKLYSKGVNPKVSKSVVQILNATGKIALAGSAIVTIKNRGSSATSKILKYSGIGLMAVSAIGSGVNKRMESDIKAYYERAASGK